MTGFLTTTAAQLYAAGVILLPQEMKVYSQGLIEVSL